MHNRQGCWEGPGLGWDQQGAQDAQCQGPALHSCGSEAEHLQFRTLHASLISSSPGSLRVGTRKALSQCLEHTEDQKVFTPVYPIYFTDVF